MQRQAALLLSAQLRRSSVASTRFSSGACHSGPACSLAAACAPARLPSLSLLPVRLTRCYSTHSAALAAKVSPSTASSAPGASAAAASDTPAAAAAAAAPQPNPYAPGTPAHAAHAAAEEQRSLDAARRLHQLQQSSLAATRLSWHRSLTRTELLLLLSLLSANVAMLFVGMMADDEAAARKAPGPMLLFLWRHCEANTFNLQQGRPHTLLTASLRHGDAMHCAGNMLLLMAVAPGVLAALGPRRAAGLYALSAAAGFGAELIFWDYIHPLLHGRKPHPSKEVVDATLKRMVQARRAQQELPLAETYNPSQWRAVIGASPAVLGVAAAWTGIYWNTPLGRSPMGRVICVALGLVALQGVVQAFTYTGAKNYRSAIVVHSGGAAVGALYYLLFLRTPKRNLLALKAKIAAMPSSDAAPAAAGVAGAKGLVPVQAASALATSATHAQQAAATPKLRGPAPANAHMRQSPPSVKKPQSRGFATRTAAIATTAYRCSATSLRKR